MKIAIFPLGLALALAACTAGQHETRAKIIERRVVDGESLLIKYSYRAGDRTFTDSVRTKNKVIPHDSLTVSYSSSDPGKNTLKFE